MSDSSESQKQALAGRLKEARKLAGLSQGKVAEMMDLHRPTVTEIEGGNRRVTAQELSKFAEIYDVSVSWLVGDSPEALESSDPKVQLAARELSKLKPPELENLMRLLAAMRQPGGQGE